MMKRIVHIVPKAVVVGALTDIVGTNLLVFPFLVYVTGTHHLQGLPSDQFAKALADAVSSDTMLLVWQYLLGASASILGGYVAARMARREEMVNAAASSFLCVGSGLFVLVTGSSPTPSLDTLAGIVASPLMSAFGGYIRLREARRIEAANRRRTNVSR